MVEHGIVTIEKNKLLGIFQQWGPIFRVTFEMRIDSEKKLLDDWIEVLRVTDQDIHENSLVPGNRIPGVWLRNPERANNLCGPHQPNSTCLMIVSYISSNFDEQVYLNISQEGFILIEIAQWEMKGFHFFNVYMDGNLYVRMQNQTPANYTNVNVFGSDSINLSFGEFGQMRNLEVGTWLQQPTDCYISKSC